MSLLRGENGQFLPKPWPPIDVFGGIEMGPGQFYTVRITSPNNEGGCGTVTNTATVAADNASEISDSGSVTVICPPQ
jgi:hypothetical protein